MLPHGSFVSDCCPSTVKTTLRVTLDCQVTLQCQFPITDDADTLTAFRMAGIGCGAALSRCERRGKLGRKRIGDVTARVVNYEAFVEGQIRLFARFPTDDLAIYRKSDFVVDCYQRNLPIRANINRITEPVTSDAAEIASNLLGSHESTAGTPRVHDRRLP